MSGPFTFNSAEEETTMNESTRVSDHAHFLPNVADPLDAAFGQALRRMTDGAPKYPLLGVAYVPAGSGVELLDLTTDLDIDLLRSSGDHLRVELDGTVPYLGDWQKLPKPDKHAALGWQEFTMIREEDPSRSRGVATTVVPPKSSTVFKASRANQAIFGEKTMFYVVGDDRKLPRQKDAEIGTERLRRRSSLRYFVAVNGGVVYSRPFHHPLPAREIDKDFDGKNAIFLSVFGWKRAHGLYANLGGVWLAGPRLNLSLTSRDVTIGPLHVH